MARALPRGCPAAAGCRLGGTQHLPVSSAGCAQPGSTSEIFASPVVPPLGPGQFREVPSQIVVLGGRRGLGMLGRPGSAGRGSRSIGIRAEGSQPAGNASISPLMAPSCRAYEHSSSPTGPPSRSPFPDATDPSARPSRSVTLPRPITTRPRPHYSTQRGFHALSGSHRGNVPARRGDATPSNRHFDPSGRGSHLRWRAHRRGHDEYHPCGARLRGRRSSPCPSRPAHDSARRRRGRWLGRCRRRGPPSDSPGRPAGRSAGAAAGRAVH